MAKKKSVSIHEAKTHLSQLLRDLSLEDEVIITKSGNPIAKIIPFEKKLSRRIPGKEKIVIDDSFNDPLPEEVLEDFWK